MSKALFINGNTNKNGHTDATIAEPAHEERKYTDFID